jgi:hypothetical protein
VVRDLAAEVLQALVDPVQPRVHCGELVADIAEPALDLAELPAQELDELLAPRRSMGTSLTAVG